MKKTALLVFSAVLLAMATGCNKENASGSSFAGIEVNEVGENYGNFSKLYVLNEGAYPGASTLDLLDFKNRKYCTDIFAQANPEVVQGLGNTANDMLVADGKLWVALNASNQVAVLHLPDAKLEKVVDVESPRYLLAEGGYVYVTSYAGAVYGSADAVPGKVYRIDRNSYATSTVEVGYQPEGLAVLSGKLYVANSGGYNYVHDNRISVINLSTFKLEKHIEAPLTNLFQMAATKDRIWVSSYGESTWTDAGDGNWVQSVSAPQSILSMTPAGEFTVWDGVHANRMSLCGNTLVCFGNDAEMEGGWDNCLYFVNTTGISFQKVRFADTPLSAVSYPYAVLMNPSNNDIYVVDASFTAGSKLYCLDNALKLKWKVDTGVGTGHLLLQ